MLDQQQTIAHLVLDHSECAEVFQRHRIDFCCRGDATVQAAAQAKGIEVEALVNELSVAIAERRGQAQDDPRQLPTPQLIAYIVSRHHQYLRKTLPVVQRLALKVSRVHGERNPKLRALDAAVATLTQTLSAHIDEEERVLFPCLIAGEPGPEASALLASMLDEHRGVADLLEQIRAGSDDFALPEWACNSYRTLFSELEQLERDTFAHVHLENHALLPRFVPEPGSPAPDLS